MSIIQADHIRHSYDSKNFVLNGISIRLDAGGALAITMLPHVVALGMTDAARIAWLNLGKFEKEPANKCADAARIARLNLGKLEKEPADNCADAVRITRLNLLQGWSERS